MRSFWRRVQPAGPPHPGEILRDLYLEPMKISVLKAANSLGMTEAELYRFLRGKEKLTVELAGKLALMFGTTTQFWLNLQEIHEKFS